MNFDRNVYDFFLSTCNGHKLYPFLAKWKRLFYILYDFVLNLHGMDTFNEMKTEKYTSCTVVTIYVIENRFNIIPGVFQPVRRGS